MKFINNYKGKIQSFILKLVETIKVRFKKFKFRNDKAKVNYKELTLNQIENELKRETYKNNYRKVLMTTVYFFIIILAVSALVATFIMPVLQISASSMEPTFNEGDIVVSFKTKKLKQGDVIAFYYGNKILVKRIIASSGSWVNIDEKGRVYVNGDLLEEDYVSEFVQGDYDIEFPYQVPDGKWFVLGDEREVSIDSRNKEIGCVSDSDIIGKVMFRIWPLIK